MDLGATQQTREKPGSTVTFPSALLLSMNVENPSSDQNCVLKGLLQGAFQIHTPGPGRLVSVPVLACISVEEL